MISVTIMAANNSSNADMSAKLIGAQLQSLLKIPPIKKKEESKPVTLNANEGTGKRNGMCFIYLFTM